MSDKRCTCEFRIKMLGDGCRYCQPQEYIDRLHDSMEDMVHLEELSDEEILKHFSEYWNHIGQIQIDEDFLLIAIRAIIKEITE